MLNEYLGQLNDFMYTYILIFLLIGSGVYFTIRTCFVQVRRIGRCAPYSEGEIR